MTFADKNILLTGGSSGIGKATAKQLAAAGANLFIVARDPAKLANALSEIKADARRPAQAIEIFPADVTQWGQVRDLVNQLAKADRIPDYLFNFAGYCLPGYFHEQPLSVFHEMMSVNYFGMLHTVKAVAPFMMQRRSGHIINTSSVAGFVGAFGYAAYSAAKYACRGFSEVLRSELKPYGIRVSILFPPDTDTPGFHKENELKPAETFAVSANAKLMTAEQVANILLRAVARGRFLIIPGFEGKLAYALSGLLSPILRAKLDADVRDAQKKCGLRPCDAPLEYLMDER